MSTQIAPNYSVQQFRKEAIAYLSETQPGCATWATGDLLYMLRHTPAGARIWNDAQNARFWER